MNLYKNLSKLFCLSKKKQSSNDEKKIQSWETSYEFVVSVCVKGDDVIHSNINSENRKHENI